ncbi:MAG TPA: hypothetical protein PLA68_11405, partial [Panacibacter sp.]|nr:hypothetical protein [Panacibacter sp.]
MLSENHNNFHWKNKLEDADSLPGETLPDKNAAWEKLHARIHEKPRRKGFVWYWLAAACLLAAITIPVVLVNKKQGNLVKATLDKIEPKKETVPEIAVPKENEIVKTLPVVTEKKAAVKTTIQTKKVKPAANNIIQKPEAMATGLNEEKAIKQPAVLPAGTVDTTTSVTLATVIEK